MDPQISINEEIGGSGAGCGDKNLVGIGSGHDDSIDRIKSDAFIDAFTPAFPLDHRCSRDVTLANSPPFSASKAEWGSARTRQSAPDKGNHCGRVVIFNNKKC